MASGNEVTGNCFYRCNHAVFINGGFFNKVQDNTFIDCIPNIEIDAPGFTYAANYYGDNERSLYNNTKKIIGDNQLYLEKYPEIQTIMELEDLRQPFNSVLNVLLTHNSLLITSQLSLIIHDFKKEPLDRSFLEDRNRHKRVCLAIDSNQFSQIG